MMLLCTPALAVHPDLEQPDSTGIVPLELAAIFGNESAVNALYDASVEPNRIRALFAGELFCQSKIVALLLSKNPALARATNPKPGPITTLDAAVTVLPSSTRRQLLEIAKSTELRQDAGALDFSVDPFTYDPTAEACAGSTNAQSSNEFS